MVMSDLSAGGIYIVATLIALVTGVVPWRHRETKAAHPLSVAGFSAAVWSLGLFPSTLPWETVALAGIRVLYVGVAVGLPAVVVFALEYTGREGYLTPKTLKLLAIHPILLVVFVFLNPGDLFFIGLDPAAPLGVDQQWGPAFWLHSAYAYLLVLITSLLVVDLLVRTNRALYRGARASKSATAANSGRRPTESAGFVRLRQHRTCHDCHVLKTHVPGESRLRMYLAEEAWPDLESHLTEESLAIVPLGSTEQHGPHLPEGTDHIIAEGFARAAAERTGYLRTPTINIGVSPHHRQFHGTMWVEPPVFRDYVESFTRNLAYHGIDRVIFVNAHGGNVQHLREVGRRLRDDGTIYAIEWMWNESIPDLVDEAFAQNGPHGGPKETALIQHLRPELVHEDRLAEARDGGLTSFDEATMRQHGARTFYDAIDNTENGVLGDQTDATAAKGKQLFEAASDQLVDLSEWLAAQPFADLMPKDHV